MLFRKKLTIFFMLQFILGISIAAILLFGSNRTPELFISTAYDLQITDLCLSTEARHTRHPAFPDLYTPFQDLPGGPDRYASSTLLYVPPEIWYPSSEGIQ